MSINDEIEKLKEKVEQLEFTLLWKDGIIEELENKRIYYRMDREKKFKSLHMIKTDNFDRDEDIKENIRIKEMNIHEKYEFIEKDYEQLTKIRDYIMDEVKEFRDEEVATGHNWEQTPLEILEEVMDYIKEQEYIENIIDTKIEEWITGADDIPESLRDGIIDMAYSDGEIISRDTYDEVYDDKEELLDEKEKGLVIVNNRYKKSGFAEEDKFKNCLIESVIYPAISSLAPTYEEVVERLFNKIDQLNIQLHKYKSGYETLKECNEENDMIDMMEKIMDKTEDVSQKDVDRCKEINRLKKKSNKYLSLCERAETMYINTNNCNEDDDMLKSITLNKNFFIKYWKDTFNHKIVISNDFMNGLIYSIKPLINEYLTKDTALRDEIKGHLFNMNKEVEKNKDLDKHFDLTHLENDKNASKYKKELVNEDLNRHHWRYINYDEEKEKITDIYNY